MKVNPVYLKDLKSNAKGVKFMSLIVSYTTCLSLIVLLGIYAAMHQKNGQLIFNYQNSNQLFTLISSVELGFILFIVPILTSGAIAEEREKQTLDLLLTSKLNSFHIICGKMAYSITSIIILMISCFPICAVITNTGAVPLRQQGQSLLLLIVTAIYIASIGILFSTIMKRTILATMWTYMSIIIGTIGTIVLYNLNLFVLEDMKLYYIAKIAAKTSRFIFLLNPVATFVYINASFAESNLAQWFPNVKESYWIELSIFLQMISSLLFIGISSIKLNPLSEGFTRKNHKKRKTL